MQEVNKFHDILSNYQLQNFVYFEKRNAKHFIYKIYVHLYDIYK